MSRTSYLNPLILGALLSVCAVARADFTVITSQSAFLSSVTDSGLDNFDDLAAGAGPSTLNRTTVGPAYSYSAKSILDNGAADTLYLARTAGDTWLSTNQTKSSIEFSSFSPSLRAIGAYFLGSADDGSVLAPRSLVVIATDSQGGTSTQSLTSASATSFLGFVSTVPLASLSVVVSSVAVDNYLSTYVTVNDLYLGSAVAAVPEPGGRAMMLAGIGFVGFIAGRRSRRD